MKMNNKGLTLVELLAVLIVLILLFLLAVAKVNDLMDQSEINSIKADAISYVKAVNGEFSLVNSPALDPVYQGLYSYDELKDIGVKVSGTKPDAGYVFNVNNKTLFGCFQYGKRKATIVDDKVTEVEVGKCRIKSGYNSDFKSYFADYTGKEQIFTVKVGGKYLIEAWGGQGGDATEGYVGGYGAYSRGYVNLDENEVLYINVGGSGKSNCVSSTCPGGYNGGGNGVPYTRDSNNHVAGGGGASVVSLSSGILSSLSNSIDDILIIASGGGGAYYHTNGVDYSSNGGSGGGIVGATDCNNNTSYTCPFAGNQYMGGAAGSGGGSGSFGKGGTGSGYSSGGGAGLYGGGGAYHKGTAGGSSYIANPRLYTKSTYCYNCEETDVEAAVTYSTTNVSEIPTSRYAKKGNGYIRIILVEETGSSAAIADVNEFSYRGAEQKFLISRTGTYKLEVWGAQGGSSHPDIVVGGYGGYATGNITLNKGDLLYVNVGGKGVGSTSWTSVGGYNGGATMSETSPSSSGGGATHIALKSGLLSSLSSNLDKILIVAGAGGGSYTRSGFSNGIGGHGGGYVGVAGDVAGDRSCTGGSQSSGGIGQNGYWGGHNGGFGAGGGGYTPGSGGGAGFYGGGGGGGVGGGGGSGYIGNTSLTNKAMYCYDCTESDDEATKTISTTCVDENPVANCAKKGNGYAKLTFIE